MACRLVDAKPLSKPLAGILLIGPLGTNFSEILIEILTFSFKKMRLKVSSAKWRPFCLSLNVLNSYSNSTGHQTWSKPTMTNFKASLICVHNRLNPSVPSVFIIPEMYHTLHPYSEHTAILITWECHGIKYLSALLSLCAGNPSVTDGFPAQRASNTELWLLCDYGSSHMAVLKEEWCFMLLSIQFLVLHAHDIPCVLMLQYSSCHDVMPWKNFLHYWADRDTSSCHQYNSLYYMQMKSLKWKICLHFWPFVQGIHWLPVDSQNKGPAIQIFKVPLLLAWIGF